MRRSLRSWLWRVPVAREVDDEIAFHVEMRTRDLVARGMDPDTARKTALARFGSADHVRQTCVDLGTRRDRKMRLARWVDEFHDDVRYALRQMRAAPLFTLVAVATLALGIGANSAIFALADATFLRSLPFPEPDRLVRVWEDRGDGPGGGVNPLEFLDWAERSRSFEAMAAVTGGGAALTAADGTVEQVPSLAVTSRFFDVLGVVPRAGRTFRPEDEGPSPEAVVLGEGLWRSRFGGDPALVGGEIRIGGRMMTVIGIVPAGAQFDLPGTNASGARSVWTLLNTPADRSSPAERYPHYLQVIGRLAPGVTIDAARADMTAVADALARDWPATNAGHGVAIEPLRRSLVASELRLTSMLLLGVVGFVLLLCCANVANLLLARTNARVRELAVRSAIGAGRRRIVRQLLTESLVLAAIGALAGAALGAAILRVAPAFVPPGLLPAAVAFGFDGRVVAFCMAAALAVALACGLVPAWQAARLSPVQAMAAEGRTATGRGARTRSLLTAAEVAVAVLLLCGAGLLLRTLVALDGVDSGAGARDVLTMVVGPGMSSDPDEMRRFYDEVEREVAAAPGVRGVALGSALPLDGRWYGQAFRIVGDPPRPDADRDSAGYQIVSASYFETLEIPVVRGRDFSERDTPHRPQVAIVNEAFVRRYLAGRDPIGAQVEVQAMVSPPQAVAREIVGVVGRVRERPDESDSEPQVYVPLAQNPWWSASLVVRPAEGLEPASLTPDVRAAIARVDRDRPPSTIRTLDDIAAAATARPRLRAALVGSFAALALVLAMVGVFGVLAYSVQARVREIGIRMALGAGTGDVLRLVLGQAARMIAAGAAIGLVAAALAGRWMSTLLFGVQPVDTVTYGLTALVLCLTAAAASAAPAWRAARVDPVVAFRDE